MLDVNDVRFPDGKAEVRKPEVERRQNHISEVDADHPLLLIALDCLKDVEYERPSSQQLCERVAAVKESSEYRESSQVNNEVNVPEQDSCTVDREIRSLKVQQSLQAKELQEKDRAISAKDSENQKLRLQLQRADKEMTQVVKEREKQLGCVRQQLEVSEQVIAQFERRITELELQLSQEELKPVQSQAAVTRRREPAKEKQGVLATKLRWGEGVRAPSWIVRWSDAVVDGNTVYIRGGDTQVIYAYDTASGAWSQLPYCMNDNCSITVVNGLLTTVGGYRAISYSNQLFSLTGEGNGRRWTEKFPPMPTKRRWTTALCTGKSLIVAGGSGEKGVNLKLSTVEVMNTETCQWSTAAHLPEPLVNASATLCGNSIYLLGGKNISLNSTRSVYTTSLTTLLRSCRSHSLGQRLKKVLVSANQTSIWSSVASLPVTASTCVTFHDQLLAIGGSDTLRKSTAAIHMYNPSTYSWELFSRMSVPRHQCFAAVLPDNQLMVMGGYTDSGRTDTVEMATYNVQFP